MSGESFYIGDYLIIQESSGSWTVWPDDDNAEPEGFSDKEEAKAWAAAEQGIGL